MSVAEKQRKLIISMVIPNAFSCFCGSHAAAQTGCVGAAEEGVLLQKARVPSPASQTLTLSKVALLGRAHLPVTAGGISLLDCGMFSLTSSCINVIKDS